MVWWRSLTFLVSALYLMGFSYGYTYLGFNVVFLAFIPIALAAWTWQRQGGLISAGLFFLVNLSYFYYLFGESSAAVMETLPKHLLELAAYGVIAYLLGTIAYLRMQLKTHKQASDKAKFDPLTGLLNRSSFEKQLEGYIALSSQTEMMMAVLFVDLDKFKQVNDSYGHDVGDALLKQVAKILKSTLRQGDLVARLGGDEFMLLLSHLQSTESVAKVAEKIVKSLSNPLTVLGKEVEIGASVGISLFPEDGTTAQELIKSADIAMYTVKTSGRNRYELKNAEMRKRENRRKQLEKELRSGLDKHDFELLFQPQIDASLGTLVGFEALLRWQNTQMGIIKPSEFLPLAESIGLLLPLDRWALREACHHISRWRYKSPGNIRIAVNVSAVQFRQADFVDFLAQTLAEFRLEPSRLELELSETVLASDPEASRATAKALKNLGVALLIDDFGSGNAAIGHLQGLDFSGLKLGIDCVKGLPHSKEAYNLAKMTAFLAHSFHKRLSVGTVESKEQHKILTNLGCEVLQGFYYAKPVSAGEAEKYLQTASSEVVELPSRQLFSSGT